MTIVPVSAAHDPSVFDLATPLLRRWRLMVAAPLACGAVAAGLSFLVPPTYTASTTFTPDVATASYSVLSGLAGFAGQFGLPGLTGSNASPDFFASVLKSRELMKATLLSEFRDQTSPAPDS